VFSRPNRLRRGADIITVLRKGRRQNAPAVTCSFIAKPATLGRIAVIVDTKVSKRAVVRNLIKRRVRSIVRELGLPQGDLVIRVWKGGDALSFDQLHQQVRQCLGKLA